MSKESIELDEVTIKGRRYIPADSGKPAEIGEKRIIVADRGWVFVGACDDHADGSVTIRGAKNIRRWGTTAGLGQLVNGPLSSTVADDYGTVRVTPIAQIAVIGGW